MRNTTRRILFTAALLAGVCAATGASATSFDMPFFNNNGNNRGFDMPFFNNGNGRGFNMPFFNNNNNNYRGGPGPYGYGPGPYGPGGPGGYGPGGPGGYGPGGYGPGGPGGYGGGDPNNHGSGEYSREPMPGAGGSGAAR